MSSVEIKPAENTLARQESIEHYRAALRKMPSDQAIEVAAEAMFHLQVMVGSRNTFERVMENNEVVISRSKVVEDMHHEAYQFYAKYK